MCGCGDGWRVDWMAPRITQQKSNQNQKKREKKKQSAKRKCNAEYIPKTSDATTVVWTKAASMSKQAWACTQSI